MVVHFAGNTAEIVSNQTHNLELARSVYVAIVSTFVVGFELILLSAILLLLVLL